MCPLETSETASIPQPSRLDPAARAERQRQRTQDGKLARRALRGDEAAYGELVRRYMNIVVGFLYNRLHDFHRAEDLAQDTFLKAYHRLDALQDPTKFGSWLLVIARHTCMDHLRSLREHSSLDDLRDAGHEPHDEDGEQALEALGEAEIEARVLEAISELREDYRDIIVMKHIENLSYREIGDLLGMSVSAVGEKLSRVRQLLRKRLSKSLDVELDGRS
jgi:RNA polymerase sigma-70 factor (ECF subfamily)